jgi:hypothetical protein
MDKEIAIRRVGLYRELCLFADSLPLSLISIK